MYKRKKQQPTYNYICFTDLVYEFDFSDKKEIEKKIKRKLKYYKKDAYNQSVVDTLRSFKNELYKEIYLGSKSKYYNKTKNKYADLSDFNIQLMKDHYIKKYSLIKEIEMINMINFAVYIYHIR